MAEDLHAGLIAMPSSKTSVHQARGIGSLKTKIAGREEAKREVDGLCEHQIRELEGTITKHWAGCSDDVELQDLEQLKNRK